MNRKLRILLVEDNQQDRVLIMRALSREVPDVHIKEITEAKDFAQALDEDGFDLAITDYQVYWTNGLEVLRAIKARWPDRPVIMFTSTGSQEIAVEAMKEGLDDYIIKSPKHYIRLPPAVRSVMERAESKRKAAHLETRLQDLLNQLNVGVFRATLDGQLLEGNTAFLRLLGVSSLQEAQTINFHDRYVEPENLPDLLNQLKHGGRLHLREAQLRRADGSSIWVSLSQTLSTESEPFIEGLIEDITERKQAEEQIRASLREKEVLLREIHHRVKNNLQVVSSLLNLQSKYVLDDRALEMFKESQSRVKSVALIHEELYKSEDLAKINFADYVRNLAAHLFRSYGVDSRTLSLKISVDDLILSVGTAILCGLIINELVSNSLKHAFPAGQAGEIRVELHADDDGIHILMVSDDGVGLPEDLDFFNTESLGLQLVGILTHQLGGAIALRSHPGTAVKITFREPRH
jgi:two-component system response regulator